MLQWMRWFVGNELNSVTIPNQSKLAATNYDNWLKDFSYFSSEKYQTCWFLLLWAVGSIKKLFKGVTLGSTKSAPSTNFGTFSSITACVLLRLSENVIFRFEMCQSGKNWYYLQYQVCRSGWPSWDRKTKWGGSQSCWDFNGSCVPSVAMSLQCTDKA